MAEGGRTLSAIRRDSLGGTPAVVRRAGFVPAVLYGRGTENLSLAVEAKGFAKLLREISSSTLLTLHVGEGDPRRVLVQEVQRDPLADHPIHVDFHQVLLTERIRADVPLKAAGVSPAVKDLGGILVQNLNEIEVEALPEDLPSEIAVDLSQLATFADRITVADLAMPAGVEVHAKPEEVVAVVTSPRTEEELKELEEAPAEGVAEVKTEAEEKKAAEEAKKTEEESAEGGKKAEEKAEKK